MFISYREKHEKLLVPFANTVINPRAMMVHFANASLKKLSELQIWGAFFSMKKLICYMLSDHDFHTRETISEEHRQRAFSRTRRVSQEIFFLPDKRSNGELCLA